MVHYQNTFATSGAVVAAFGFELTAVSTKPSFPLFLHMIKSLFSLPKIVVALLDRLREFTQNNSSEATPKCEKPQCIC